MVSLRNTLYYYPVLLSCPFIILGGVGHCFAWHVRVSSGLIGA
jgi:hypothetical protein